jgi:hypothetical protein
VRGQSTLLFEAAGKCHFGNRLIGAYQQLSGPLKPLFHDVGLNCPAGLIPEVLEQCPGGGPRRL